MEAFTAGEGRTGPGLLEAMRRYWWLILLATVLTWGIVGLISSLLTPRYVAIAELLLADPGANSVFRDVGGAEAERRLLNEVQRIESSAVTARSSQLLGGRLSPEEVAEAITIEASIERDVLTIRAADATPRGAADLANVVADAYQQVTREQALAQAREASEQLGPYRAELQAVIDDAERQLAGLRDEAEVAVEGEVLPAGETLASAVGSRLAADPRVDALQERRGAALAEQLALRTSAEEVTIDASLAGAGVSLFEPATVPTEPSFPNPQRDAALAAVLALVIASAYAWVRSERTQGTTSGRDAAGVLGAPLLGEVPVFVPRGPGGLEAPAQTRGGRRSPASGAYHYAVTSFDFALAETLGSVLLITSPGRSQGKSTTALNLAVAAARDGRRVVLVDADLRTRSLTRRAGLDDECGLTDLADSDAAFERCLTEFPLASGESVDFVTAGSATRGAASFFRTQALQRVLARIADQADLVIVDSPPVLTVSDTSALAARVDGIVLVVDQGTPVRLLEETRRRLDLVTTPLLGCVFNRSRKARAAAIPDRPGPLGPRVSAANGDGRAPVVGARSSGRM